MILNRTRKQECGTCRDTGNVVVNVRRSKNPGSHFEEMAPCPYCEQGRFFEFPPPKDGKDRVGPWGEKGYWRDRAPEFPAQPAPEYLPPAENRAKFAELAGRLGVKAMENEKGGVG